jgi:hypothetical protein
MTLEHNFRVLERPLCAKSGTRRSSQSHGRQVALRDHKEIRLCRFVGWLETDLAPFTSFHSVWELGIPVIQAGDWLSGLCVSEFCGQTGAECPPR